MKLFLLSFALVSVSTLAACQSSQMSAADASSRQIEMAGAQARYTVDVPQNARVASASAPFALEGSSSGAPAMAPGAGYQAR